jgi:hypothetical protein
MHVEGDWIGPELADLRVGSTPRVVGD